ncbi:hypothetical protein LCGC14_0811730 [marine sediment metagenome]|uniref:Uncharacterized protein n=1 Tax=marine sediment metagenome TaxID=412755 RepID=A0A0F9PLJ0_9ZZZZ
MPNDKDNKTQTLNTFLSKWLKDNVVAYVENAETPEDLATDIIDLFELKEEAANHGLEEPIKRRGQGE